MASNALAQSASFSFFDSSANGSNCNTCSGDQVGNLSVSGSGTLSFLLENTVDSTSSTNNPTASFTAMGFFFNEPSSASPSSDLIGSLSTTNSAIFQETSSLINLPNLSGLTENYTISNSGGAPNMGGPSVGPGQSTTFDIGNFNNTDLQNLLTEGDAFAAVRVQSSGPDGENSEYLVATLESISP